MRILLLICLLSWSAAVNATDFYVGGVGASDSNPGTSGQPFATIQKAASVARSGDVVIIRAGVYRETVTPAEGGITFQSTEGAVISGLNVVSGAWTVHSGNIYKITLNLPHLFKEYQTGFGRTNYILTNNEMMAQQIFKDGKMQSLAAWPKTPTVESLLERSTQRGKSQTSNFTQTTITDGALGTLPNLTGGYVWVNGWFLTHTRVIASHNGNTITFPQTDPNIKFSRFYRVTGKLGLLTEPGEWHWENNTLYYWQPGGGAPTGIEFKVRNWGFDLRGKANTKIIGLSFIGCDALVADAAATNVLVDNIRSTYMNHTFLETRAGADGYHHSAIQTGIKLMGSGSIIRNSEFRYSAGNVIWAGSNTTIQNNYFSDYSYNGQYAGAVKPIYGADNIKILNNTATRSGRGFVELTQDTNDPAQNIEIAYNDVSMHCMLNVDGGAVYSSRNLNHSGLNIHHNWFHDMGINRNGEAEFDGIQITGVYFDQAAGPATIHHNVHWNGYVTGTPAYSADFYNQIYWAGATNGPSNLYNNTYASSGTYASYVTYITSPNDVQRNNIYRRGIVVNWGASPGNITNCLLAGVSPQFVNTGNRGLAFRLAAGSPAINGGVAIAGITDGSIGNPDMGAYEYGGPDWVPGYQAVPQTVTPNISPKVSLTSPAANASFTQGATISLTATATDDDGTITRVEFFNGSTKIGEDLTSPYAFTWNNAPVGTLSLTARATDNRGAVTTSSAVSITVVASANSAPTVGITSPAANSTSVAGTAVNITASASDSDGTVAKVEFFNGSIKLGEDVSSPYSFSLANPAAGTYSLIARATDDKGAVTNSATVNITVTAPAVAPVVSITAPANGASFTSGTAINISATASDADGTVTKVEFFSGTTKLGEDTTSPYTFAFANPTVGTHALVARATDDKGTTKNSSTVSVTVNATVANTSPSVAITSPVAGSSFASGATINITATASDSDGTVSKVEFFSGSTKIGEDLSSPYSFVWSGATVGSHSLTARATDNAGATKTSGAVTIDVAAPQPDNVAPTIAITSPTDAATAQVGEEITISATASDSDGSVTNVEFYDGSVKIGEDSSAPFQVVWSPSLSGSYSLTAVATDDKGATATSAAIAVTVNEQTVNGEVTDVYSGIPRFFSPNNDGTGDTWTWSDDPRLENASVEVRNRAGAVVYQSSDYDNTWDGRSDGKPLLDGEYFYIARLTDLTVLRASIRIIR